MSDEIFVIDGQHTLQTLPKTPPVREVDFQKMIEDHPRLLAGALISPEDPCRWLLIKREMAVPDTDTGQNRWSLDHLFVDHTGRPTLVEIKRAADTRTRREVVGQMFDYAANAQIHWDSATIRQAAVQTHGGEEGLLDALEELLGSREPQEHEAFWRQVQEHIEEGHMRLLFVCDQIPSQLRRIIEYLNEQLDHVEVLGVEIAHYTARDPHLKVLVPRLIGQTERLKSKKASTRRAAPPRTTKEGALNLCDADTRALYARLIELAEDTPDVTINWGSRGFSITYKEGFNFKGFPPNLERDDAAYVEFSFPGAHFTPAQCQELRASLTEAHDVLTLSGRYSLKAYPTDADAIEQIERVYDELHARALAHHASLTSSS